MQLTGQQAQRANSTHAVAEMSRSRASAFRQPIASERYGGNQAALRRLSRTMPQLQRKLAIGAVNDPLEAEADQVADQVMRMPDPTQSMATGSAVVRRKCAACEEEDDDKKLQKKGDGHTASATEAPPIVHEVLGTPGQPLDLATRELFEPRFGVTLASIRVHNDELAGRSARSVGAVAYTTGRDIVFAPGLYQPQSLGGK